MKGYRVEFSYIETDGSVREGEMRVPIGANALHRQGRITRDESGAAVEVEQVYEGPWVSNLAPYEGPLTDDELRWLAMLPGKDFSAHWRFSVTEVK